MPLIGVILPSHEEMKADYPGRPPRWVPPDELLQGLRLKDPKFGPWPYEVAATILAEHQERDYLSTTLLLSSCPRSSVLERREDYVIDLQSRYAAIRGTLVHKALEANARPSSHAEVQFKTTVAGLEFSGTPDIITAEGDLYDYKLTESPPSGYYPWRNHTLQGQYNAFLARQNGVNVRSASVVYLGPKYPQVMTHERKLPWVTKAGKKTLKGQPYVWTDREVLEGHGLIITPAGTDDFSSYHAEEPGLEERLNTMADALEHYPRFLPSYTKVWGGTNADWRCPGKPWCKLPDCLAKRYPGGMAW